MHKQQNIPLNALLDFTVSKIFTGKCDAMVEVTLNNYTKVKVIHFGTN